jgi:hypothetical protein
MPPDQAAPSKLTVIVEIVADEDGRWLVRLFKNTYGEYTDKRVARVEALEAAKGAQQLGYDVEVWTAPRGSGCFRASRPQHHAVPDPAGLVSAEVFVRADEP